MKFQSVIIATNHPDQEGDVLTPEALQAFAQTSGDIPVSLNFIHRLSDSYGRHFAFRKEGKMAWVECEVDLCIDPSRLLDAVGDLYVVPVYIRHDDGRVELTELALTHDLSDHGLPSIGMGEDLKKSSKGDSHMSVLRCKMRVQRVTQDIGPQGNVESEEVKLMAVYGPDNDNAQWSKWTPSADFSITINNPDAFGKLTKDHEFYVDFTPVEKTADS